MATASDDKTARLWDREGRPLAVLDGHTDGVIGIKFAPDGRSLAVIGVELRERLAVLGWQGGQIGADLDEGLLDLRALKPLLHAHTILGIEGPAQLRLGIVDALGGALDGGGVALVGKRRGSLGVEERLVGLVDGVLVLLLRARAAAGACRARVGRRRRGAGDRRSGAAARRAALRARHAARW